MKGDARGCSGTPGAMQAVVREAVPRTHGGCRNGRRDARRQAGGCKGVLRNRPPSSGRPLTRRCRPAGPSPLPPPSPPPRPEHPPAPAGLRGRFKRRSSPLRPARHRGAHHARRSRPRPGQRGRSAVLPPLLAGPGAAAGAERARSRGRALPHRLHQPLGRAGAGGPRRGCPPRRRLRVHQPGAGKRKRGAPGGGQMPGYREWRMQRGLVPGA